MIFIDTNVLSESFRKIPDMRVAGWLARRDAELALPTIVIAEIAFGIFRLPAAQRSPSHEQKLSDWRNHFRNRIFGFTEEAALAYGELMGRAKRQGVQMSTADGMIAAIALANGGRLATRNVDDFRATGLQLVSPWDA
ncbi:toxin FitB [Variibacter gotjawalensis]|uniref:Ribonuclease VapC n=1 Tax=Variibacter gotjawalensis TaxID=1333996 RepID=A0A0S3PTE5_9BRAD|nr:type II toxin-antitoxin system VapC family toxin [Variibacter gotjawalensis]RZS51364.1 hypothetical protein EV661_3843 [Variibacter gotjawalensis]BAT59197.1 toxin FitB [Variibacter gotjawalensis]